MMEDDRCVELRVGRYESTFRDPATMEYRTDSGWRVFARVGHAIVKPPMSERLFETRDEALREAIAWVRLRAVHTNPDGSMRDEVK